MLALDEWGSAMTSSNGKHADAALLQIDHVSKVHRGGVRANDDISLSVNAGEVFGLLGPNGAGKTTLVNQVIGLVRPTSGIIRIGVDQREGYRSTSGHQHWEVRR